MAQENTEMVIPEDQYDNLGERASWMRGSYGLSWDPADNGNGRTESADYTIEHFLEQVKDLRTVDFIQVHLGDQYVFSPIHAGPNALIESLWQGDLVDGQPINLAVPRSSIGRDPFLDILLQVKEAGLKTQVYANSSNLLRRDGLDSPDELPDVTDRWMNWCDTNAEAQAFINSQSYHVDEDWPNRKYMFCYAEFILKDYAIRYGDLVDAWIFDSGRYMWQYGGDIHPNDSDDPADQRLYKAFANAVHAGNLNAAVAFNNSPGHGDPDNPFSAATRYEDYMFGHPFNGGKNVSQVGNNIRALAWSVERDGYIHRNDPTYNRTWDDNVQGHFYPPMSTGAWNAGGNPGVPTEDFIDFYGDFMLKNGSVAYGIPLDGRFDWTNGLLALDYAMEQLTLLDEFLIANQDDGNPNWSRQSTVLPDAFIGQGYAMELVDDIDFWDTDGEPTISLVENSTTPLWLSLTESLDNPGTFILAGNPTDTEPTKYIFDLKLTDGTQESIRTVELEVKEMEFVYPVFSSALKAMPAHNYGVDQTATFSSQTSAGTATFDISIDVIPSAGTAVNTLGNNGNNTEFSWGVDVTGAESTFKASDNESAIIQNIRISNFQANDSDLEIEDIVNLSFQSITIVDGNNNQDRVGVTVNDIEYATTSQMSNSFETLTFSDQPLSIFGDITAFMLSPAGNMATSNRWAVDCITVDFDVIGLSDPNSTVLGTHPDTQSFDFQNAFYPNPTSSGFVTFNNRMLEIKELMVYDFSGAIMANYRFQNFKDNEKIDVSNLKPGLYLLKSDKGMVKIVKR